MSATADPQTFTRLDLSTEAEPHVVVLIDVLRRVREVIGPFPDEAAAFGFIGEHDLGTTREQVALIAPLTDPVAYAERGS